MSVREYIGARYIPVFSDPIQWDNTLSYEPLTVVMNQGTSYVSKQSVPEGVDILNETYWLRWADYNAQLEEYIRQVQQYNSRIQANTTDIDAIEAALPIADFDSTNTVTSMFNDVDSRFDVIEADDWVTTDRIADSAITSQKMAANSIYNAALADKAVTGSKINDRTVRDINLAHNEVIVIFGDSWSAENVTDSVWYETIREMFNNAEIHNYAINGCHTKDASFVTMYNQFVNDTSFDKNTITRVILMYGVNDCYTYPISVTEEGTAITNFYNAVINLIPNHVPIHWFINFAWGRQDNTILNQMNYWTRVIWNTELPRIVPHFMWSWFNVNEMNQSNYFHLTQRASRYHLAHNIYACLTGGTVIENPSYSVNADSGVHLDMNINEQTIDMSVRWPNSSSTISLGAFVLTQPAPQALSFIETGIPGGFARWATSSSGSEGFVNRLVFAASANNPVLSDTLNVFNFTFTNSL